MAITTFNYPLYEYAVAWFKHQAANPVDFIAPTLKVPGKLGTYPRYPQGYAFRSAETKRALYEEATTININAEEVPFKLEADALRIPVDDDEVASAGDAGRDQVAQAKSASLLATWRTSLIQKALNEYRAQVAAEDSKGAWSGSDADPIEELRGLFQAFRETNGVAPNRLLFSDNAWSILANNAEVKDMVAFNDAKVLTPALLLKLLFFEPGAEGVPQIMCATVPVAASKPGPGVPFSGVNALGTDLWLTYVDDGNLVGDMCGLRQLRKNDDAPIDSVVTTRNDEKHTTFYEVSASIYNAVTAPSCVKRLSIS